MAANKAPDQLIDILKNIQARKTVKPEDATRALQQYQKVQEHIKLLKKEIEYFKANKAIENEKAQLAAKEKEVSSKGKNTSVVTNGSRKSSLPSKPTTNGNTNNIKQPSPAAKKPLKEVNGPKILNGPTEPPQKTQKTDKESVSKQSASTTSLKSPRPQKVLPRRESIKPDNKTPPKTLPRRESIKPDNKTPPKEAGEKDKDSELARLRFQNAQLKVTLETRATNVSSNPDDASKGPTVTLAAFPEPDKLVDEFRAIHENEWRSAFHDLDKHYKFEEDAITDLLATLAKEAYNFCQTEEKQQFEDIKKAHAHLTDVLVQPKYATQTRDVHTAKSKSIIDKDGFAVTRKFLREYRKAMGRVPIPGLVDIFEQLAQRDVIARNTSLRVTPKSVRPYIQKLIEVNWLMALQEPPMAQLFPRGGQLMNRDWFTAYSKKGATVIHTVWPALFLHREGALAERGVCVVK
ncbi:uncharacterized protein LOC127879538 [Dreissena polymorpha]|uniref:Mitochondria-eating protein C-terminal domain-containing protein n=1 Tax=Dreissena polymorpha TaxID=45954 RepID=A0A9D4QKG8_DREPO|nr:uncharacterized protein LOC127879538 [Dreissena polymorpha]KAH3833567.1 hypothetical protein DPMN_106878 [Dreissena polymorpha]